MVFVDVPGHTRFINNMIAGINGIDMGMLVIAADDGPMPQTREHMDVLQLLGVTRFILVITKIDRVESKQVKKVREEALSLFTKNVDVPVFEVNTPAEKGIDKLAGHLENEADALTLKLSSGYFRLSIDRIFLIKGSGLVVTGTLASGSVKVGDTLVLLPHNVSVRVRSLQVQEQQQQKVVNGQRCALNIVGDIEKDDIERGDWLVEPNIVQTTFRFDAKISLLEHAPFSLKHLSPLKLYIGAKRIPAKLVLLEDRVILAGETALAQLTVERPLQCCHGDRFLIRDDSENETLGGGIVLDPYAATGKKLLSSRLPKLDALQASTARQSLESLLFKYKQTVNLSSFCLSWNIREDETINILKLKELEKKLTLFDYNDVRIAINNDNLQSIKEWLGAELDIHSKKHFSNHQYAGLPREKVLRKFREKFPGVDFKYVLGHFQSLSIITLTKEHIALPRGEQLLSEEQQQLWDAIEAYLIACDLQIPGSGGIGKKLGYEQQSVMRLCKLASKQKWLIMVADNRFALTQHIKQLSEIVLSLADKQQYFSVADFKNECVIGRNLAVEVLEYFDRIGFTLRKESGRVILHKDRFNAAMM